MLSHEVVDAVKKGQFHIWSVRTIDEGIEILTGVAAGKIDGNGSYSVGTIHGKVGTCLEGWIERAYRHKKKMQDLIDPPKKNKEKQKPKTDAAKEKESKHNG